MHLAWVAWAERRGRRQATRYMRPGNGKCLFRSPTTGLCAPGRLLQRRADELLSRMRPPPARRRTPRLSATRTAGASAWCSSQWSTATCDAAAPQLAAGLPSCLPRKASGGEGPWVGWVAQAVCQTGLTCQHLRRLPFVPVVVWCLREAGDCFFGAIPWGPLAVSAWLAVCRGGVLFRAAGSPFSSCVQCWLHALFSHLSGPGCLLFSLKNSASKFVCRAGHEVWGVVRRARCGGALGLPVG